MKLIKKLLVILSLCTFLYAAYLFIYNSQNPDEIPKLFGYQTVKVLSGSMEPTFSAGDLLFLKETEEIKVGSVILFEQKGVLVTHRVVDVDTSGFRTKGDANTVLDANIVSPHEVRGIYAFHIPLFGYVIESIASIYSIMIGVFLISFTWIFSNYHRILKVLGLRKKYVRYKPQDLDV
ncbi:signal peptidase I [Alteribacillus bidgolensis]|uniref:Signal peptidase I n=1 Tax=Alteribacillus bidgolensis TaxID=930129 RepID=A0A1G8L652_9BACI|nr:signal peptidase I [Alteribacillus bidgolensis]SDI50670.1 signal peptidase, endoplasmic reticulum-type [Alteribacillus bidgolensis]